MKDERGFTLVETLVAFAILALTLTALYTTFGTGLRGLAQAGNEDEATLLLESKLDEVRAVRALPDKPENGAFPGGTYRWTLTPMTRPIESDTNAPASPLEPRAAKLEVNWVEDGRKHTLAVETVILVRTRLGQ